MGHSNHAEEVDACDTFLPHLWLISGNPSRNSGINEVNNDERRLEFDIEDEKR